MEISLRHAWSSGEHWFVVLHDREGIVEVVEQLAPSLVFSGVSESLGVVLEPTPLHQQQVGSRSLDAAREGQPLEALHSCDDRLGFVEGGHKGVLLTLNHSEDGMFEDHLDMLPVRGRLNEGPRRERTGVPELLLTDRRQVPRYRVVEEDLHG